ALQYGGHVQPALMREGAGADVRLIRIRHHVDDLADVVAHLRQHRQLFVTDHGQAELELEVSDDADDVGVAAALAVAVDAALDLHDALGDGGEGVGDGQLGIVVGVYSERHIDGNLHV